MNAHIKVSSVWEHQVYVAEVTNAQITIYMQTGLEDKRARPLLCIVTISLSLLLLGGKGLLGAIVLVQGYLISLNKQQQEI